MRRQPDAEVQIAGRRAAGAGLALGRDSYAREVADARRNPDINGPCVPVVLDGQPARRAAVRVREPERDLLLDIAALLRGPRPPATAAAARLVLGSGAAEERVAEVREWIGVAEQLAHFLFGHGADPAPWSAPEADVPGGILLTGRALTAGAGLFVHPPVGAELVVFLALLRIAEHFVRFVDLLELRLGGLLVRVD